MLKKYAIRYFSPISFRSPKRLANILLRFSHTESDSGWQLLQALNAVDDLKFKNLLFHNALEERHHGALFWNLAQKHSVLPLPYCQRERRNLFGEANSLYEFEVYHYVGEVDVYSQFEDYAKAAGPGPVRELFNQIRSEEEGHQELAYNYLVQKERSNNETNKLIKKVRRSRLYDSWVRSSKRIGDSIFNVLFTIIYFLFTPFLALTCRRRMNEV